MNDAKILSVARGDEPADLVLKNLQLVNVHSGEVYPSEIAVFDGRIIGVGAGYEGRETLDLGGRYVAPAFIDAHVHIESSLCMPSEFAKAVIPHGVTTVITDPHEIANVLGVAGIRFMLENAEHTPLRMYVMASSCVPATHMETSGASLEADDLAPLLDNPWVIGLAEMMNYPGLVFGDPKVLAKVDLFRHKILDGHCPALTGKQLNAYKVLGIQSDHECTSVEEAREKLRAGMTIFIREATNAHNLDALLPLVTPENHRRICFCTDDRQPADLLEQGSIDYMVRRAIQFGLDPITAIRLGTLNTAEYFRLYDLGAIVPGYQADMIVFNDLNSPSPEMVFVTGKLTAHNRQILTNPSPVAVNLPLTVRLANTPPDLSIPAEGKKIRVIGSLDGQLITTHRLEDALIREGEALADVERDLLKMVVLERHHGTGNLGKGFIHGFGLKRGAIAGTVAHDHHNIVAIGVDDASLKSAINALAEMGGGLVAVDGEQILASLPLPIAGLMSDQPIEKVREQMSELLAVAAQMGSTMHDPFMAMSFMALEVIPSLKLTDLGLVDVEAFQQVGLWID